MIIKHKAAAVAITVMVLGMLPTALPGASAGPPVPGVNMAYGTLSAVGWTTSPVTSTPDPAQWQTWPSRSWQLALDNVLYATGTVNGWCDESKGWGTTSSNFSGYEGVYYGGSWGVSFGLRSIRWTGAGRSLAFTADMEAYDYTPLSYGEHRGTLVGTITLFTEATLSELCFDGIGLQQPIPVMATWAYVLQ